MIRQARSILFRPAHPTSLSSSNSELPHPSLLSPQARLLLVIYPLTAGEDCLSGAERWEALRPAGDWLQGTDPLPLGLSPSDRDRHPSTGSGSQSLSVPVPLLLLLLSEVRN